jgi:YfiR/HmsC-like
MPPYSAINFVVVDDKVRFDVAPEAFDKANLRVSARLLTVARKVMGTP